MISSLKKDSKNLITIYIIIFILIVARFVFLCFSETDDADAVSRYLISLSWLSNPYWIKSSVWGPFHFYFLGGVFQLAGNNVIYGKIATLIVSILCLIPLYFFTRKFFSKTGALFVCICWLSCPIVMKYSLMNMSELWQALFILTAMALLVYSEENNRWYFLCLAGLSATLACGFRYEAWLLSFLISTPLLVRKKWKEVLVFGFFAGLFPAYWLYTSYLYTGDALYSLHASVEWNITKSGVNDFVSLKTYLSRSLFFPFSIIIGGGIIIGLLLYLSIFLHLKNKTQNNIRVWLLPFLILLVVFIYKGCNGTLLCQHRFSITLFFLALPFTAYLIDHKTKLGRYLPFIVVLSIPLSFTNAYLSTTLIVGIEKLGISNFPKQVLLGWTLHTEAIPLIRDEVSKEISKVIKETSLNKPSIIIDFYSWGGTYYVVEQQELTRGELFISSGATHVNDQNDLYNFLSRNSSGILLLKPKSKLHTYLSAYRASDENIKLCVSEPLFYKNGLVLYQYQLAPQCTAVLKSPENFYPNKLEEIKAEIIHNELFLEEIKIKARVNGITTDEMLTRDAQYILDHP